MLFTPRLFKLNDNEQKELLNSSKSIGQFVCVIPREQCSFRRIKMPGRGRKPMQATLLKLRQQAASLDNMFHVSQDDQGTAGGAWEYPVLENYAGRSIPESLLYPSMSNGSRLIKNMSGFEGQVWKDEALIASRWWQNEPSHEVWNKFLYNVGIETGLSIESKYPELSILPYTAKVPILELDWSRVFSPLTLASVLFVIFAGAMSFEGARYARIQNLSAGMEQELSQKSELTSQILTARRRALSNIQYVEKHKNLEAQGSIIFVLSGIGEVLDGRGLFLKNLNITFDDIEMIFQTSTENSVPDIVNALEEVPGLSNVSISIDGRNDLKIEAQVATISKLDIK